MSQYLDQSEWLQDAKRVPVGQSRRVYHGAERRPNLQVWNNTDSWSCYCHACHLGGRVRKEVLQRVQEAPPVSQKYVSSSDCCTFDELAAQHPQKFKRLVLFLHSKCMSTTVLAKYGAVYNLTDDRVVLGWKGAYIGRDVTERHHAKWYKYYSSVPMEFVYLRGRNKCTSREPVVLTEDLFSAIKINHYTGVSTLCCLGTHIHDSIIQFLVTETIPPLYPVLSFDGDNAGDTARRNAAKRLGIRGVEFSAVDVKRGYDPKDYTCSELQALYNHLGESHGS